ncbi:hypothetical protein OG607_37605 [Streptomyces sp. NBC_01537]|uniref:hypothetical protein n=1 Tax=Streptomyces sp. NBC_01537 TaxID=2903896 RepID=UPI0038642E0D
MPTYAYEFAESDTPCFASVFLLQHKSGTARVLTYGRRSARAPWTHRRARSRVASPASFIFAELFEQARSDGKLPGHVDTAHLARPAQSMVSEGARHWAAGVYGDRSFAEIVGRDIAALVAGFSGHAVA